MTDHAGTDHLTRDPGLFESGTHPASAIGHIGVIKMTTKFIGKAQPIMPDHAYIRIFAEISDLFIGIYLCHINTSAP